MIDDKILNGSNAIPLAVSVVDENGNITPQYDGEFELFDSDGYCFCGKINVIGTLTNIDVEVFDVAYKEIYIEYNEDGEIVNYNLRNLKDGSYLFVDKSFNLKDKTFVASLPLLENSQRMFSGTVDGVHSFDLELPKLKENVYLMFDYSMTTGGKMVSFKGNLTNLEIGDSMFSGTTLINFEADLEKLSSGKSMFSSGRLGVDAVERILTTIPTYNDGKEHVLEMRIMDDESCEKFKEITGFDVSINAINGKHEIYWNGWTIIVYRY